jgi:hypothetical protein
MQDIEIEIPDQSNVSPASILKEKIPDVRKEGLMKFLYFVALI